MWRYSEHRIRGFLTYLVSTQGKVGDGMSRVLTQEDLELAYKNLFDKGYTYVDNRQMLGLYGITFSDKEWEKLEKALPVMIKEYLDRG